MPARRSQSRLAARCPWVAPCPRASGTLTCSPHRCEPRLSTMRPSSPEPKLGPRQPVPHTGGLPGRGRRRSALRRRALRLPCLDMKRHVPASLPPPPCVSQPTANSLRKALRTRCALRLSACSVQAASHRERRPRAASPKGFCTLSTLDDLVNTASPKRDRDLQSPPSPAAPRCSMARRPGRTAACSTTVMPTSRRPRGSVRWVSTPHVARFRLPDVHRLGKAPAHSTASDRDSSLRTEARSPQPPAVYPGDAPTAPFRRVSSTAFASRASHSLVGVSSECLRPVLSQRSRPEGRAVMGGRRHAPE
jgi:hypothetical protein